MQSRLRHSGPLDLNAIAISGSRYWKPLTLVVEDAQPTKIVMTGSIANINGVAGDFTIAGFTVSSLSKDVTNKIITLTLSIPVIPSDTLTVVYKGKSYSVTNNTFLGLSLGNELFYLGGEIFQSGGNYYIQDKSGHGKHFLITGYDFDSAWTKGFPYKSNATISAPAGDATLIAADIYNYLYAPSTHTPNQIPVISLFQDIEFAHKIFCKHAAQIVDGNEVETYEPRVLEVVMYSSAKAGGDLTTCRTYFGVPTEATSNVMWVDPVNGSDGGGSGTKANPYKSLGYAEYYGSNGITVYVRTGTTTEGAQLQTSKIINWQGIGLTKLTSSGASWVVLSTLANGGNFEGFTIDGGGTHAYLLYTYNNATYKRLRCINPKASSPGFGSNSGIPVINNCLFPATKNTGYNDLRGGLTNDSSLILSQLYGVIAGGSYSFKNAKIVVNVDNSVWSTYGGAAVDSDLTLKGCNIHILAASAFIAHNTATGTKKLSITYCKILNETLLSNGLFYLQTVSYLEVIFSNNQFVDLAGASFNNQGKSNWTIENNHFDITSEVGVSKIVAGHNDFVLINNNTILQKTKITGYGVIVGYETTGAGDNTIDHITLSNNKLLGLNYYIPGSPSAPHGLMVGFQATIISIKNNYVDGHGIGLVLKGSNSDYTNCVVQSNIFVNNTAYGIYFKGVNNCKVYGNTLINNGEEEIRHTYNVGLGTDDAIGNKVKNNIICNTVGGYLQVIVGALTNIESDYNVYYSPLAKPFSSGGVDKSFAEWQALGFDIHSIFLTANQYANLLTNTLNKDFSLKAGSAAIGTGVALDAAYDDGLDASTVWGTDSQLPVVVTKQQSASWDIGAYIH
jgi:parallel beta-helix repeat protein